MKMNEQEIKDYLKPLNDRMNENIIKYNLKSSIKYTPEAIKDIDFNGDDLDLSILALINLYNKDKDRRI
jgi:hypothetical protein